MKTLDMTCANCFYSQESYAQVTLYGRTKEGVATKVDDIYSSSAICHVNPKPLLISQDCGESVVPDVHTEPEYHSCGQGRWRNEEGDWVGLIEAEDA